MKVEYPPPPAQDTDDAYRFSYFLDNLNCVSNNGKNTSWGNKG